ncbi:SRPBCC family protein [Bradyrhizobium hereditatis]|uniref:SRPBCC family protein n=1 Tax=Bradyrhizobium hereditatis TaxID=2821405 RepID=UPI001CE363D4|nr:SRPBCC family protein [Bradyrhizobium hereditatis]
MTTAYYSTVLNHPLETVWALIRDFNNYPAYIDGVSESMIEDDKGGDAVGAIRRFCYLGNWIRQRLAGHSDQAHSLTMRALSRCRFRPNRSRTFQRRRATKERCICFRSSRATEPSSNGR